jgi:amino acid adenylation domain-containing protein/thioester reductase-like protein
MEVEMVVSAASHVTVSGGPPGRGIREDVIFPLGTTQSPTDVDVVVAAVLALATYAQAERVRAEVVSAGRKGAAVAVTAEVEAIVEDATVWARRALEEGVDVLVGPVIVASGARLSIVVCSGEERLLAKSPSELHQDPVAAELCLRRMKLVDGPALRCTFRNGASRLDALSESVAESIALMLRVPPRQGRERAPVGPRQRSRLLTEYNGRPEPLVTRNVRELLDAQLAHRDRPCAHFRGQTMTYGQLDDQSRALVGDLLHEGIGPGDLLPLVMQGGFDLLVSIVAAVRLGAVFVPLDRAGGSIHLAARLIQIGAKVVLVEADDPVGLGHSHRVLRVARDRLANVTGPATMPQLADDPLIYGYMTSGSTGIAKCALNRHAGLANRFLYMTRRFRPRLGEAVLQNSRHSFDSAMWQLLWPLTFGGRVVVPEHSDIPNFYGLTELVNRHGVTMTDFVPSVFAAFVDHLFANPGERMQLASLRYLLIGGEKMNAQAVAQFRRMCPHVALINTYGPTEASIGMVFHETSPHEAVLIPLGRAIDNTYAVVLGEASELVPMETIGEICIGGECLGGGYLGDPERTATSCIPNPFREIPGPRLYRTGDAGYLGADGLLYYVGRRDGQVKISGIRIELEEIEHSLRAHSDVADAHALLSSSAEANTVVAWAVPRAGRSLSCVDLATWLRARLPSGVVVRVLLRDAMPRTANGKLDGAELSRDTRARLEEGAGQQAGLSEAEERLAELWKNLLGIRPGAASDFFDLGGGSLMALRCIAAIQRTFGKTISAEDFYSARTLSGVAHLIDGGSPDRSSQWLLDTALADQLPPPNARPATTPRVVLVTGATGFVGSHLVAVLAAHQVERVYCLVRARDAAEARHRVLRAVAASGTVGVDYAKVVGIACDLSQRGLGLSAQDRATCEAEADAIVHAAAVVDFLQPYAMLRNTNTLSSAELLAWCSAKRSKAFYHISSSSVDLSVLPEGRSGYEQSKWVVENLLDSAGRRGFDVTSIRIGEAAPSWRSGASNPRSALQLLLAACVATSAVPAEPIIIDYVPVDWLCETIAERIVQGRAPRRISVMHPTGIALTTLAQIVKPEGRVVIETTYDEFHARLADLVADEPSDLARLLCLLPAPGPSASVALFQLLSNASPCPDDAPCLRLSVPALSEGVFSAYRESLRRSLETPLACSAAY